MRSRIRKLLLVVACICSIAVMMPLFGCENIIPPAPDVPTITYAEFPFTLVYELDGEEITVNDTVICEYAGNVWDATGRYRIWDLYYMSGNVVILKNISEGEYIALSTGRTASYYMGDTESPTFSSGEACGYYRGPYADTGIRESYVTDNELYEEYGVRIISFEIAPPIENTFVPAE